MDPQVSRLVRETWSSIQPRSTEFSARFYELLFAADPDARDLFRNTDMPEQSRKFGDMLTEMIAMLESPDHLVAEAAASGRRHAGYGVEDRHYEAVGAALLRALEEGLGPGFDAQHREAWREMYALIAALMRRGAAHGPRS